MDSIYNALTEEDRKNIYNYLKWNSQNANYFECPKEENLPRILRYWEQDKRDLYTLLDNNLILSQKITVPFVEEIAIRECAKDDIVYKFISKLKYIFSAYGSDLYTLYTTYPRTGHFEGSLWIEDVEAFVSACKAVDENPHSLYDIILSCVLNISNIINNKITWSFWQQRNCIVIPYGTDGDTVKISYGEKTMKAIGKIVHAIFPNLIDEYEEFRIRVSQITNQSRLSGDLCLSIHPLDFMTMSDNSSGWSTCMSWKKIGEYRSGTVEMMNSSCVVIGYLKSETEKFRFAENRAHPSYEGEWNSKKWRCLFIVTNGAIVSIKPYPYYNEFLVKSCLKWLKKLYDKNLAPTPWFDPIEEEEPETLGEDIEDMFQTDNMYNDFGSTTHFGYFNEKFFELSEFNYSGMLNCMCCGDDFWTDEEEGDDQHSRVACCDCDPPCEEDSPDYIY